MFDLRYSTPFFVLLVCGALLACSDDDQSPRTDSLSPADMRPVEAGVDGPTEGGLVEGGLADVGTADAGSDLNLSCQPNVDLAPLTLSDGYCVVAKASMPHSSAFALALHGNGPVIYGYQATPETRAMVIRSYALDLAQGTLGASLEVFGFSAAGEDDFFAGTYLVHHGDALAVGYTLVDYTGHVLFGTSGATPQQLNAPGNFDAAFLDSDQLLVNGLGLGTERGQAVYALEPDGNIIAVIDNLPGGSGFLARGDETLYAGYFDYGTRLNVLYAFTLAEVRKALARSQPLEISAGDLVYEGDLADIATRGDDLILIDASADEFRGVHAFTATALADAVVVHDIEDVVTPGEESVLSSPAELSVDGEVIALRLGSGDEAEIVLVKKR